MNLVFQNDALFPHFTVWDNVAFGPRSHRLEAAVQIQVLSTLVLLLSAALLAQGPRRR